MIDAVNRFYNSIENVEDVTQKDLVSFFFYFLTEEIGQDSVKAKDINECFSKCHLDPPTRTATYLSEGYKVKPKRFLKAGNGVYKLEHHHQKKIATRLGVRKATRQISKTLRDLEKEINDGPAENFLRETIDCFEVGANRATVVMVWILVVDHLYSYIMTHKKQLTEFNKALAKNPGGHVRIKKVAKRDDFCEIREGKFIELCKQAGIISTDVHRILEVSVKERNSSAHPSGVEIAESKVISTVEDLVRNVILKYKI